MSCTIRFFDHARNLVATAEVEQQDGLYRGSVDLALMPADQLRKFEEYEETVNGQILGLLDRIEDEIAAMNMWVTFQDGRENRLKDLHIFPCTGSVSFRLANRPAASVLS